MSAHLASVTDRFSPALHGFAAAGDWNRPQPRAAWDRELPQAGVLRHFRQDQEICGDGGKADYFFKVVSGTVRTCKFLDDGRRHVEAFHTAGDVFGYELGEDYSHSAEAVSDCTVLSFHRRSCDSVSDANRPLQSQIFAAVMESLKRAQRHNMLLGCKTAIEKVAAFLLDWAGPAGAARCVDLTMTRQDMGDYLGLTIETVSRMLSQLERQGLIELESPRHIKLKNAAALAELKI